MDFVMEGYGICVDKTCILTCAWPFRCLVFIRSVVTLVFFLDVSFCLLPKNIGVALFL